MYEPILPQGPQAALMPGAAYSVPGLFLYSSLVCQCLDQVEAKFGYRIPVRYLYGSPQARWNCGRPIIVDHGYTMEDIQAELQGVLDRGITFKGTVSLINASEIHEQALALALQNLRRAGTNRNRGFGQIECEMEGQHTLLEQAFRKGGNQS